jgi:hypothetical protein
LNAPLAQFSLSEQLWRREQLVSKQHSSPLTAGHVAALLKNAEDAMGMYIWGGEPVDGDEVLEHTLRCVSLLPYYRAAIASNHFNGCA